MIPRFLLLALVAAGLSACANIATEGWPDRVREFPLSKGQLTENGIEITVGEAPPISPDDQEAAGERPAQISVLDTHSGSRQFLNEPCAALRILASHNGWPQLEVWSHEGGGAWSRSLYRVSKQKYDCIRTDEYSEFAPSGKVIYKTALPGGGGLPLYFVQKRLPNS